MKTILLIEDGNMQLVLTPENKWEKDAIGVFREGVGIKAKIHNGRFYQCDADFMIHVQDRDEYSVIVTMEPDIKVAP